MNRRVMHRPMFRKEALRRGHLKPIKAQSGDFIGPRRFFPPVPVFAVIFHLLNTGGEAFPLGIPKAHSYNFELAAMYVLVLGYFTVSGAGKYSVDEQVLGGEFNIYKGLFAKVFGGGN